MMVCVKSYFCQRSPFVHSPHLQQSPYGRLFLLGGGGAHVRLGSAVFPNGFDGFYNNNGKKAGTYTYNENTKQWSFRAR
jgi:hypothetical protein